jgi:VHL beta domain
MEEQQKIADSILKTPSDVRLKVTDENSDDGSGTVNAPGTISYEFGLKPLEPEAPSRVSTVQPNESKKESVSSEPPAPATVVQQPNPNPEALSPADAYEHESACKAAQRMIDAGLKSNTQDVADVASRLLMDLSEHRVSPDKAMVILNSLGQTLNQQSTNPTAKHPRLMVLVASIMACLGLFIALSLVGLTAMREPVSGPVIAGSSSAALPSAWQYLPVAQVGQVRSLNGTCSTRFMITNGLAKPVNVFWLNYRGEPVNYMRLSPGETREQQTYATHPWLVQDDAQNNLLLFTAGTDQMERITVK